MLVQLIVFIKRMGSWNGTGRRSISLARVYEIDADTQTWLGRINLHLCMLFVLLAFRFNLVHSLFK